MASDYTNPASTSPTVLNEDSAESGAAQADASPDVLDAELANKFDLLCETIAGHERMAVAFSGGVDSTLLLKVAHEVLGDDVLAVTTAGPSVPAREVEEAREFCRDEGIRHVVVETHEFDIEGFDRNPPDRCYLCKREILTRIREAANANDIWAIAEGSNTDDEGDFRPGFRAVQEMDVISPLKTAGFSKSDVRMLARHFGLGVWDKPALACLNTRFAYGEQLVPEHLKMVDAAEEALRAEGFSVVRVRMQDMTARIEVPEADLPRLVEPELRHRIVEALRSIGFAYVSVDLQGYRMGSMNETL